MQTAPPPPLIYRTKWSVHLLLSINRPLLHCQSIIMSPENVTGYLCSRESETGPCVTKIAHPCEDHGLPKKRRKAVSKVHSPFKPPKILHQETPLTEDHPETHAQDVSPTHAQSDLSEEEGHDAVLHGRQRKWTGSGPIRTRCSKDGCNGSILLHIRVESYSPSSGGQRGYQGTQNRSRYPYKPSNFRQGFKGKRSTGYKQW